MTVGTANLCALLLGFISWGVPALAIWRRKYSVLTAWLSFVPCVMAVIVSALSTQIWIAKRDWSALEDTNGVMVFAGLFLLIVTVVLNVWAYLRGRTGSNKDESC